MFEGNYFLLELSRKGQFLTHCIRYIPGVREDAA